MMIALYIQDWFQHVMDLKNSMDNKFVLDWKQRHMCLQMCGNYLVFTGEII